MKKVLVKTMMATVVLLATTAANADLGSRFMTQPVYSGATGQVHPLGFSHQDNKIFFEQDFKKMSLEQKEFVALNLLREFVFFNVGTNDSLAKMTDIEKEIFVNKSITDPIHQRIKLSTQQTLKDIVESTDFNSDKNPQVLANLKNYLVQVDLLVSNDKMFDFVNDYRYNRVEPAFDSKDLNKIWTELFATKYGKEILPQAYVMFDTFNTQFTPEQVNQMFDKIKK